MRLLTLRKLHRWVALVVGLQILLWTTSGLVFAWVDQRDVDGDSMVAHPEPQVLPPDERFLEPTQVFVGMTGTTVTRATLHAIGGTWYWRLETDEGVQLRRASDGAVHRLDAAEVRRLAVDHYRGTGQLVALHPHAGPTLETRDAGATWQADFADPAGTSLYFSADDGALVAVRTDTWRLRDFFWMLHTMDYRGRDDFNHPLVVLAGTAAAWVALTGLWLLFRVFRRQPA